MPFTSKSTRYVYRLTALSPTGRSLSGPLASLALSLDVCGSARVQSSEVRFLTFIGVVSSNHILRLGFLESLCVSAFLFFVF